MKMIRQVTVAKRSKTDWWGYGLSVSWNRGQLRNMTLYTHGNMSLYFSRCWFGHWEHCMFNNILGTTKAI